MEPHFPAQLLPSTARVSAGGLVVGDVAVADLAAEHGTPLLIYDEDHLRQRCAEVTHAFPDGASYAAKAFLCRAVARIVYDAGLGVDVASGGEMAIALRAGVPAAALTLHGNNKSSDELAAALDAGVGRIVIDSRDDFERLARLAAGRGTTQRVALRVNPGVTAGAHPSIMTGQATSKFGVAVAGGVAADMVGRVRATPHLTFTGIHVHAGSQVTDLVPLMRAITAAAEVATACAAEELIVGGGLGVALVAGQSAPTITEWGAAAHEAARAAGFAGRILAEPGRAIVCSAAITVYSVGTVKHLGEHSIVVAVDGGISDNPRPALYGSAYQPLLVRHPILPDVAAPGVYTVVGKNCESSDTFARNVAMAARPRGGDLLCLPATGAYTYAMSSNYNGLPRPAVVMVSGGTARLILRRETLDDLCRTEVVA